jgi:hypothetical protein
MFSTYQARLRVGHERGPKAVERALTGFRGFSMLRDEPRVETKGAFLLNLPGMKAALLGFLLDGGDVWTSGSLEADEALHGNPVDQRETQFGVQLCEESVGNVHEFFRTAARGGGDGSHSLGGRVGWACGRRHEKKQKFVRLFFFGISLFFLSLSLF